MRVRALSNMNGSPISDDDGDVPNAATNPPRVLVLGPENSGKTTIAKTLTNYAIRAGQNWAPLLANVDPSEGAWAIPGTISAAPINAPLMTYSPSNPLGSAATSAPMAVSSNALFPLVYWYGHATIAKNPLLMERLIRNLGQNVDDRWEVDVEVNVILVVGHEKLNVEMQRTYGSQLTVVKIPKSGGVVELDQSYRERVYGYQLHTYMYGQTIVPPPGITTATIGGEAPSDFLLAPSSTAISFDDLTIYRVGAETMAPTSALPIGAARAVSEMQPVKIDPSQPGSRLLNAILSVLIPSNPDENERYDEEILDLPVMGFIVVTGIDAPNRKLTVLSPNQGSISGRTALIGTLEWQEQ
ncbi:hypothetical protein ONZ45_g369 [Pleurotus djamor]|nr:hypothetical protein ONZ45_g369 [Pleurotus djamor]